MADDDGLDLEFCLEWRFRGRRGTEEGASRDVRGGGALVLRGCLGRASPSLARRRRRIPKKWPARRRCPPRESPLRCSHCGAAVKTTRGLRARDAADVSGAVGAGVSVRASDMMNRPWERRPKEEDVRQAEPMRPQEVTASIKGKGLVAAKRKQARSPPVCAHSPATSCRPLCPPPPSALRGALTRRGAAQTAAANCSDDATFSFSAFSDPGLELHPHLVPPLPPAPAPPFARCHASASARRVTGARAAPQVASLKERFGASRLTRIQQVRVLAHLPRDAVCPISTG